MQWLLVLGEWFARKRFWRHQKAADRWLSRAERLRQKQGRRRQPDLFEGRD